MAQVKFTTTDIFARLAKGECANFRNGACVGGAPCAVLDGAPCDYFAKYVKPLLDFPEFETKYRREAKVTVALNPKAKVVRRKETVQAVLPGEKPSAPRAGRAGNSARRPAEDKPAAAPRAGRARPQPAAKTPPPVPTPPLPPQPAKARKPAETEQQLLFELPAAEPARKRRR